MIKSSYVGKQKCFVLEKEEGVPDSRRLVFLDNNEMQEFKTNVTMMCNLKMYIEQCASLK